MDTDYFYKGKQHFSDGNYDDAIEELSKSIEINPLNAQSYMLRGSAYRKNGKIRKAISDYNTAIKLDSRFAAPYIIRGDLYAKIGNFSQAILNYNRALVITPLDDEIYIRRGNAWSSLSEYEKAIDDFNKAIAINGNNIKAIKNKIIEGSNIKALLSRKSDKSEKDQHALAEAYLNRGIATLKKRQDILLDRKYVAAKKAQYANIKEKIITAKKSRQYTLAKRDYEKILKTKIDHPKAFLLKGEIAYQKGDYDKAISIFTEGINDHPKNTDGYLSRGLVWIKIEKYDAAIEDFNKALEIEPQLSKAFLYRGIAYEGGGNLTQAIKDFTMSLERNPFEIEAFIERGLALIKIENLDMGIVDFTSALKLKPQNFQIYHYRGRARFYNKEYSQAVGDYEKLISLSKKPAKIIKEFAGLLAGCTDKTIFNCQMIPQLIYSARKVYPKSDLMGIFQKYFETSGNIDNFQLLNEKFDNWINREELLAIEKEIYEEEWIKSFSEQLSELGSELNFELSNGNNPRVIQEIGNEISEINFLQMKFLARSSKSSGIVFIDPEIKTQLYGLGLKFQNVDGFKGPYYPPYHARRG